MDAAINRIKNLLAEVFSLRINVIFSDDRQFSLRGLYLLHHLVYSEGYTLLENVPEIIGVSIKNELPGYPEVIITGSHAVSDYAFMLVGDVTGLWREEITRDEMAILRSLVLSQTNCRLGIDDSSFYNTSIKCIILET